MPKRGLSYRKPEEFRDEPGMVIVGWEIRHDGLLRHLAESPNDAFGWLLRHQGQSVAYATTYGGWTIRPLRVPIEPAPLVAPEEREGE